MTTLAFPGAAAAFANADLTADATSALVVAPFQPTPGSWAGAPSAVLVDGTYWLAYRLRRPVGQGRGFANVLARSTDGVRFETVVAIPKEQFGAASLERPALVVTEDGTWRLYVSCAMEGTKHWRVDLIEARSPWHLVRACPTTVLAGSDVLAVKDPVIVRTGGSWHLWASCHPLDDPANTDRMTTEYATSPDGLDWAWHGTALSGRAGQWDARGVRVSSVVLTTSGAVVYYDGRASAEENWEERTGVAVTSAGLGRLEAVGDGPVASSPHGLGGLRYVSALPLPDGATRLYYEITRADGAHELRTTVAAPPLDAVPPQGRTSE